MFGSIQEWTLLKVNCVIKGQFQKEIIGKWPFMVIFCNFVVKFHGKKIGSQNMIMLYPNLCYNKVCYKGTSLYMMYVDVSAQSLVFTFVFYSAALLMMK